jgi:hypothetical protein
MIGAVRAVTSMTDAKSLAEPFNGNFPGRDLSDLDWTHSEPVQSLPYRPSQQLRLIQMRAIQSCRFRSRARQVPPDHSRANIALGA